MQVVPGPGGRPNLRRRRRPTGSTVITLAVLAVIAAIGIVVLIVQLAQSPDVKNQLGEKQFVAGRAQDLFDEITKPGPDGRNGPLLFQDLLGHSRDIYLQHQGNDPQTGWLAFEAHALNQPRTCVLEWIQGQALFQDPCTKRTYPAGGTGLTQYPVTVNSANRIVIDLQHPRAS
jgi:hypothetical protein